MEMPAEQCSTGRRAVATAHVTRPPTHMASGCTSMEEILATTKLAARLDGGRNAVRTGRARRVTGQRGGRQKGAGR